MAIPLQGFPRPSERYDPVDEAQFRAAVDASIAALDAAISEGVDLITSNVTFDGGVTFDGAVAFNSTVDFGGAVTFSAAPTLPLATVTEAMVTQHQAALTILESQITDAGILARVAGTETITGAWTFSAAPTLPLATVTEAMVTQHQAALTIAESQITDGSILARLAANEAVTGVWTFEDGLIINDGGELIVDSAGTSLRLRSHDVSGFWDMFITGGVGTEDETIRVFGSSGRTLNVNLLDGDLTLTAGQLFLHDGTAGNPGLTFGDDADLGLFRAGSNTLAVSTGGAQRAQFLSTGLRVVDGSATNPSYSFLSDGDTGVYRVGSNALGLASGGTLRLEIQAAGTIVRSGQILNLAGSASAPTYAFNGDPNTGLYRVAADRLGLAAGGLLIAELRDTAPLLHLQGVSGELLRLDDSATDGEPLLSFHQNGTQRVYLFFRDSTNDFRIVNEYGAVEIYTGSAGSPSITGDFRSTAPHLIVRGPGDEILRIQDESATGSPYLSFYQSGTRRAYIQFRDTDDSLRIFNDVNDDSWDFKSNGDFVANDGDVIATV